MKTLCKNAKFFIMKSFVIEQVEKSVQHGVWCTSNSVTDRLKKIYQQGHTVFLIFSVNYSGGF